MTTDLSPARMLDEAMRDRGLSNISLSRALEVQPNVVSMMRTGRLTIPAQRAVGIARWAGLDPLAFSRACVANYPGNGPWQAFAAALSLTDEILASHPCADRYNTSRTPLGA